ncbi:MAG: hypothetical protein IJB02_06195 [Oscillospiraceae bacterium]|nr:hypothetical protein [Oscillospiraceae bacterium]
MARQFDVQYIRSYTDGTAARKMEMPQPRKTAHKRTAKKMKRIVLHIDPVAILGIVMAVLMLVLMSVGCVRLLSAQQDMTEMNAYVQMLRQENVQLQEEYEAGYDLENVRQTAMALGMVPMDQVQQISIQVNVPQQAQPDGWEQLRVFLAGLFA